MTTTIEKFCKLDTFVDYEGLYGTGLPGNEYLWVQFPDDVDQNHEDFDPVILPEKKSAVLVNPEMWDTWESMSEWDYLKACAWEGYVNQFDAPETPDFEGDIVVMLLDFVWAAKRAMGEEAFHEWIGFEADEAIAA
jgi:hypothetical protein